MASDFRAVALRRWCPARPYSSKPKALAELYSSARGVAHEALAGEPVFATAVTPMGYVRVARNLRKRQGNFFHGRPTRPRL